FAVTNLGGAPITNGQANISSGPFTVLSGASFNLAGFGSTNVVVNFNPTGVAAFSNALAVSSSGGAATNTLTGSGALPPVANFSATPTSGLVPLTVAFSDFSAGTITNRFWDFGDGTTTNTSSTNLTHIYTIATTNSVILTITGPLGASSLTQTNYIAATNLPP